MIPFKPKEKKNASFFNSAIISTLISKENELKQIDKVINWETIKPLLDCDNSGNKIIYSSTGRPAWEPIVIFKMLFLGILHNESDNKVEERAKTDLAYRLFLGIDFPDPIPDETTLSRYRTFWGEEKLQSINKTLIKEVQSAGYLKIKEGVVGDTSHQEADISKLTARSLILRCYKKFINEWKEFISFYYPVEQKIVLEEFFETNDIWLNIYEKTIVYQETDKSKRFTDLVEHIELVLNQFYDHVSALPKTITSMVEWKGVNERYNILQSVLRENTTKSDDKYSQKKGDRKIISDVDIDARVGHKNAKKSFCGYKAATIRTVTGYHLEVETIPGDRPDVDLGPQLLSQAIADFNEIPETYCLDKGYDSIINREKIHELGVQPAIDFRSMGNTRNPKLYPIENFVFNQTGPSVTCPNNITTKVYTKLSNPERYQFRFPSQICETCALKPDCTTNKNGRRIVIPINQAIIQQDKVYLTTESYQSIRKKRWRQEGDYGWGKRSFNLGRNRYRGIKRASFFNRFIFFVMNVKRYVKDVFNAENNPPISGHSVS